MTQNDKREARRASEEFKRHQEQAESRRLADELRKIVDRQDRKIPDGRADD